MMAPKKMVASRRIWFWLGVKNANTWHVMSVATATTYETDWSWLAKTQIALPSACDAR